MSTDLHFLKDIIELIPAVVSLIGLLGAGLENRGGALYTKDPWIVLLYLLKQQTRIPTRDLVKIAMDLYGKMTPEMKDNLIKNRLVSPGIIQQIEEMYREYIKSTLPPYKRDEKLKKKVVKKALEDKPLLEYPIYLSWGSNKDLQWIQRVLPDGRVEWKLMREPVKNILGEVPKHEPKRIEMTSRPMLDIDEEEKKSPKLTIEEESEESEHPPPQPTVEGLPIPPPSEHETLHNEFKKLGPIIKQLLFEIAENNGDVEGTLKPYGFTRQTVKNYTKRYDKFKNILSELIGKK